MVLKSRNTMITSAILFLLVVILLRFTGGFFEDNMVRVVGAIFGGSAENIPLLDFSSINMSWLNPANWSLNEIMTNINGMFHDIIDSVLPAVINMINMGAISAIAIRVKLLSAVSSAAKFAPAAL